MKHKTLIYPLFIPMHGCPGQCIYCDQVKISGASAFDLAVALDEVRGFVQRNPNQEKEIAFYGGSFTALPEAKRSEILSRVLDCVDDQTRIRISTHPLYINEDILQHCEHYRIQTIELGIQDWHDIPLWQSKRGYDSQQAFHAACLVQSKGFVLGIQLMPGLPGSSSQTTKFNMDRLREVRPNFLRLYPVVIIRGTMLEQMYQNGSYAPLSLEDAIGICADYTLLCEECGIRIIKYGLPSNLDTTEVVAGAYHQAFGELVKQELMVRNIQKASATGKAVSLSTKDKQLLRAHGGKYLLDKRIENCTSIL